MLNENIFLSSEFEIKHQFIEQSKRDADQAAATVFVPKIKNAKKTVLPLFSVKKFFSMFVLNNH